MKMAGTMGYTPLNFYDLSSVIGLMEYDCTDTILQMIPYE
jgi:hypothetical protein